MAKPSSTSRQRRKVAASARHRNMLGFGTGRGRYRGLGDRLHDDSHRDEQFEEMPPVNEGRALRPPPWSKPPVLIGRWRCGTSIFPGVQTIGDALERTSSGSALPPQLTGVNGKHVTSTAGRSTTTRARLLGRPGTNASTALPDDPQESGDPVDLIGFGKSSTAGDHHDIRRPRVAQAQARPSADARGEREGTLSHVVPNRVRGQSPDESHAGRLLTLACSARSGAVKNRFTRGRLGHRLLRTSGGELGKCSPSSHPRVESEAEPELIMTPDQRARPPLPQHQEPVGANMATDSDAARGWLDSAGGSKPRASLMREGHSAVVFDVNDAASGAAARCHGRQLLEDSLAS